MFIDYIFTKFPIQNRAPPKIICFKNNRIMENTLIIGEQPRTKSQGKHIFAIGSLTTNFQFQGWSQVRFKGLDFFDRKIENTAVASVEENNGTPIALLS